MSAGKLLRSLDPDEALTMLARAEAGDISVSCETLRAVLRAVPDLSLRACAVLGARARARRPEGMMHAYPVDTQRRNSMSDRKIGDSLLVSREEADIWAESQSIRDDVQTAAAGRTIAVVTLGGYVVDVWTENGWQSGAAWYDGRARCHTFGQYDMSC